MNDVLLHTATAGVQHHPSVSRFRIAGSGTDLFFAVWRNSDTGDIKGRLFKTIGDPAGEEFSVTAPAPSMNTNRNRPVIASTGMGPVVAWIEEAFNPPGPRPHVKLRRFNNEGQPVGGELQVSTTDVDPRHRPVVAAMFDGGFLVTWVDARADQRIRAQRFSPEGVKKGPEFRVNTTDGFHENPIATRLVNGNYVIAWRSDPSPPGGGGLIFRIFDLEGSPVTGENSANLSGFGGEKVMTFLDNGRFVIAHARSQGLSDIGVPKSSLEVKVFEAGGNPSNIGFAATTERGINSSWPAIAPLMGGRFVLAWVQKSAETFSTDPNLRPNAIPMVRAGVFSDGQGPVGQVVQVNTSAAANRSQLSAESSVLSGEGDSVFLAWTNDGATGGGPPAFDVRGRALRVVAPGTLT